MKTWTFLPAIIGRALLVVFLCLGNAVVAQVHETLPSPAQANPTTLDIDLWPHVTMLIDEPGNLSFDDVVSSSDHVFTSTKSVPYSNLGMRKGAVWLRIKIEPSADADKVWILNFGYPLLSRAQIYSLRDDVVVQRADVGYESVSGLPQDHKLSTALQLTPGVPQELFIRVSSEGSLLVPLHLTQVGTFHRNDVKNQILQGIFAGIGLCLMVYAIIHAIILRRGMYAAYAASVLCMTIFLFALQGMGGEHLWGDSKWFMKNGAHLTIFINLASNLWFVHDTLEVRTCAPKLSLALRAIRALSLMFAVLVCLDLLNFSGAHISATTLGQASALVTVSVLWVRARSGVKVAWFVFGGWLIYSVGAMALTWTFNGSINYRPSIWNFFQMTALFEMLSWFIVLGVDAREKYQAAIRLRSERNSMQSLAETDVLTGLPNRRALMARMEKALLHIPPGTTCAVFMMDLDGFKAVNDTHGHHVGDELLKAVGRRLTSTLRGRDFVGRLGGDEFVVLTESLAHMDDAQRLADKLINGFKVPFDIDGTALSVGLTIGFALSPMDGSKAKDLLQAADQALYSGKQGGKGQARRATTEQVRFCALPSPLT